MSEEDAIKERLGNFDENNISEILSKWNEINKLRKQLDKDEEYMRVKIRVFMKERGWNKYNDKDSDINVSINQLKKESVDMKQLKVILTPVQYAQIITTTTYERMDIITPEIRERLKKFVKVK